MFHFLFTVVLLSFHGARGQPQRLTHGNHGLKRSSSQNGLSYANVVVHRFQHLQGPLLESSCEVTQYKECGFACVSNAPCVSFNVALLPNENGKLRCELLSEDKFSSPDKLTDSQQFHHYSLQVSDKYVYWNWGSCFHCKEIKNNEIRSIFTVYFRRDCREAASSWERKRTNFMLLYFKTYRTTKDSINYFGIPQTNAIPPTQSWGDV